MEGAHLTGRAVRAASRSAGEGARRQRLLRLRLDAEGAVFSVTRALTTWRTQSHSCWTFLRAAAVLQVAEVR